MKFKKGDRVKLISNIKQDNCWFNIKNIPTICFKGGIIQWIDKSNEEAGILFQDGKKLGFELRNLKLSKIKIG